MLRRLGLETVARHPIDARSLVCQLTRLGRLGGDAAAAPAAAAADGTFTTSDVEHAAPCRKALDPPRSSCNTMTAVGPLTVRLSEPTPATDGHPSRRCGLLVEAGLPRFVHVDGTPCSRQWHNAQPCTRQQSSRLVRLLSRRRLRQYACTCYQACKPRLAAPLVDSLQPLAAPCCPLPAPQLQRHLSQQGLGGGAANNLQRLLHPV